MSTASNPLPITAQPAVFSTKRFGASVALTVSTAAYSSGYSVGGLIKTSGVPNSGKIQNVAIGMASGTFASSLDMVVFSSPPTGTYTDSTAVTLTSADTALVLGVIHIASDISLGGAVALCQAQGIGFDYILTGESGAAGNTVLSTLLIARGAVTFAATSDVTMKIIGES